MALRYRLLLIAAALAMIPSVAWCWGPTGHTYIIQAAMEVMPEGLKPFYDRNGRYVAALVTLPDDWRDTHQDEIGPKHYIDLDLLDQPPFTKLIADLDRTDKQVAVRGRVKAAGDLPWAIEETYNKLVKAFKAKDANQIVLQSAVLAHYVSDAHVPFHNTKDYDGRTPEQKGVHNRWEESLVEFTLKPQSVSACQVTPVADVLKSAFGFCLDAYNYVDPICKADDKARAVDPNHTWKYFKVLSTETDSILRRQLRRAAEATAGLYIAAWQEAGKPDIGDKAAPLLWEQ